MPGLVLPEGKLGQSKDLPKLIRRSEIVLEKLAKEGKEQAPTVTEDELKNFKVGRRRQRNQQALINFFDHAAKGDLIITPEPLYRGKILIGVFLDESNTAVEAKSPRHYGPTPVPARRIRWLKEIEENTVSSSLSQSLRHQHPFSLIERSRFPEVFSLAYDSFVYGERHSSVLFNRKVDYTDRETSLIGLVSSISAVFCEAVSTGDQDEIDLLTALLSQASMEYHCQQAADIHSPGFNRFISSTATALVIAAFVASLSLLSACDSAESMTATLANIDYVNSSAPADDACTALVSETTDRILKTIGSDKLWKMCQAMKDAEARAGLESSAKIIK
ncbi:hypothetical protein DFR48_102280 [Ciceribacter lividus]|uniref:Uncharacterized protein n=2 Tax=Ciceribacter lividus TaxID=1197950 RepID=A0A6I7HU93_9HYPH|nr:hypothetical protein DFR48_102280 [Ciceribacter lividus]